MNGTLFDQVESAMLAYPENVNVGTFLEKQDGKYVGCIAAHALIINLSDKASCSITGAVAPIYKTYKDANNHARVYDAAQLLGVPFEKAEFLCYPSRWPKRLWDELCGTTARTPVHAAVAVRAIAAFRADMDAFCAGRVAE